MQTLLLSGRFAAFLAMWRLLVSTAQVQCPRPSAWSSLRWSTVSATKSPQRLGLTLPKAHKVYAMRIKFSSCTAQLESNCWDKRETAPKSCCGLRERQLEIELIPCPCPKFSPLLPPQWLQLSLSLNGILAAVLLHNKGLHL